MILKNFYLKTVLFSLALLLTASPGLALEPALTLKDNDRGTTANLYPLSNPQDQGLLIYINERFDYSVKVPQQIFTEVLLIPDNDDGIILASKDGQYRLRASGGMVISDDILETSLEDAKQYLKKNVENVQIVEKKDTNWWSLSWWNGQNKGSRKFTANAESWCELEITWPGQTHNAPGEYDSLLERSLESPNLSAPTN